MVVFRSIYVFRLIMTISTLRYCLFELCFCLLEYLNQVSDIAEGE